jgi:hypothetical protein
MAQAESLDKILYCAVWKYIPDGFGCQRENRIEEAMAKINRLPRATFYDIFFEYPQDKTRMWGVEETVKYKDIPSVLSRWHGHTCTRVVGHYVYFKKEPES